MRLDVCVFTKTVGGLLHRVGVGTIQGLAITLAVGRVAQRQGIDERAFAGRRATGRLQCLPDRGVGLPTVLLRHGRIEIGAQRDRFPPIRHRKLGIEPRGFAERANRLGVVERIQEPQPLIEEALRSRHRGRDRHVQRPEPVELRGDRHGLRRLG